MPYPILWIAEHFTLDGEQIIWYRKFRVAGWLTQYLLWWVSFPATCLDHACNVMSMQIHMPTSQIIITLFWSPHTGLHLQLTCFQLPALSLIFDGELSTCLLQVCNYVDCRFAYKWYTYCTICLNDLPVTWQLKFCVASSLSLYILLYLQVCFSFYPASHMEWPSSTIHHCKSAFLMVH